MINLCVGPQGSVGFPGTAGVEGEKGKRVRGQCHYTVSEGLHTPCCINVCALIFLFINLFYRDLLDRPVLMVNEVQM